MRKILFILFSSLACIASYAQTVKELQETAGTFMKQGDYVNAILVLNRANSLEPENLTVLKNLALAYNFQKQDDKALPIIKQVIEKDEADDQSYQIAAKIYMSLAQPREAEKIYKKGIRKFSESGPLYSEYGELLMALKDPTAIELWEKGIEKDPGYSKNYFNAAKFYYLSNEPLWTVLYGEMFSLMEPYGSRTPEMKNVVLDGYKKLFADPLNFEKVKGRTEFEKSVLNTFAKQSVVSGNGINTNPLTMIRSRFILDWDYNKLNKKYPFKLFDDHRDLLQKGLFEMYNQWLFGSVESLAAYQSYTNLHKTEYTDFSNLLKSRIFKQPVGQYYK